MNAGYITGMAYSVLASLPPVFGLYASFFPPLFYFLFGSSRHISIGVTDLTPVDVIVLLAFLTGIVQLQLVIWVLRLSFFSTYLTDSAVTGLTFGAAIHALTAQIKGLLGIHLEGTTEGFLQLFEEWLAIAERVPDTNLVTLAISISTIVFLLLYKELVEPHLRRKRISLPAELLVVISIRIWVEIQLFRLPAPRIPRFERVLIERLIVPAISIAVVSYAVTVSMGKLFARKHKYHIDPDQV
ncbi:inorganic anion transporter, SulP family [Cooperia oncophora]